MFQPEDPLAPPRQAFAQPWHAQVLALAQAMIERGCFSSSQWADALGTALRAAEADGWSPDTDDTYYTAALSALEVLSSAEASISAADVAERKREWEEAYQRTPHGKPVELRPRS